MRVITPEFVLLATRNNIVPFSFPAHLTHCMQPLDVGIFQVYKHWHNRAIQSALETLDFDYTVSSFFQDLSEMHFKPFTKQIVKGAFAKSGM
jgi:DDE superfamily endonuclease